MAVILSRPQCVNIRRAITNTVIYCRKYVTLIYLIRLLVNFIFVYFCFSHDKCSSVCDFVACLYSIVDFRYKANHILCDNVYNMTWNKSDIDPHNRHTRVLPSRASYGWHLRGIQQIIESILCKNPFFAVSFIVEEKWPIILYVGKLTIDRMRPW